MNSHEVFIHIHQGCFAGTGAIVRLPQCQWSKPDGYGKISQCITTTKHSKAKTVCIFLGIYCISLNWVAVGLRDGLSPVWLQQLYLNKWWNTLNWVIRNQPQQHVIVLQFFFNKMYLKMLSAMSAICWDLGVLELKKWWYWVFLNWHSLNRKCRYIDGCARSCYFERNKC